MHLGGYLLAVRTDSDFLGLASRETRLRTFRFVRQRLEKYPLRSGGGR